MLLVNKTYFFRHSVHLIARPYSI